METVPCQAACQLTPDFTVSNAGMGRAGDGSGEHKHLRL